MAESVYADSALFRSGREAIPAEGVPNIAADPALDIKDRPAPGAAQAAAVRASLRVAAPAPAPAVAPAPAPVVVVVGMPPQGAPQVAPPPPYQPPVAVAPAAQAVAPFAPVGVAVGALGVAAEEEEGAAPSEASMLSVASRNSQVAKYRYAEGRVSAQVVSSDLELLKEEWKYRLEQAISDEADRTGSWSLLWKAEAIEESLTAEIDRILVRALDNPAEFTASINTVCQQPIQIFGEGADASVCAQFKTEMLSYASKRPLTTTLAVRGTTTSAVRGTTASTGVAGTVDAAMDVLFGQTQPGSANMLPQLSAQAQVAGTHASGVGPKVAGSGPGLARVGGALTAEDLSKLASFWYYRRLAMEQADQMFEQLTNWTKCDGRLRIPDRRPPIEGFNHLASRLVEWLVWPYLSPGAFPVQRQVMLYGPAGAGKTVIAQLTAFDIARALFWTKIKNLSPRAKEDALKKVDLNDFVTCYFVDAMKLRSADPEVVGNRIRNYLSCLQYEVARERVRRKSRRMGILVLDNIDTLFVTDEELRRQPRAERKAAQIKSWIYKASPDVVQKLAGAQQGRAAKTGGHAPQHQNRAPPKAKNPNIGGGATVMPNAAGGGVRVGGQGSGRTMGDVVGSVLSPAALEADFPDVRLIWSARYVWKLPALLQSYVKQRQAFVDLPNNRTRRSFFESMLRDELYTNMADRLIEEEALLARARDDITVRPYLTNYVLMGDSDRKANEPDAALFNKEKQLRAVVRNSFLTDYNYWLPKPVKPNPGNLMASVIHRTPQFKALADDYIKLMSPVLDAVTTASGLSLEGYCKLQSEFGLSFSEVDMFLIATGKKQDGLAGATPFGFTLEDMQNYFTYLKADVNQRLLKQAFEMKKAFIYGSTRFASSGCKATAAAIQRRHDITDLVDPSLEPGALLTEWKTREGEEDTCKVALGYDLTNIKDGLPVIPLWARYGSHRILKMDDVMRTITVFERFVTPKNDYPEFVNYRLYRIPKLNRPLLPPSQISQMCRARPGPAAAFLFPSGPATVLTAAPRPLAPIAPWSVLFSPLPRLAGTTQHVPLAGGDRRKRSGPRRRKRHPSTKLAADHLPIDELFRLQ